MLSESQIKQFLPFLPEDYLSPRVPDAPGWRFPLAPGVTMEQLPAQVRPSLPGVPEGPKNTFTVTGDKLLRIFPKMGKNQASILSALFNELLPLYGMDNRLIFPDYLAQAGHESGGFFRKVENLNYSEEGLRKTFSKYFPTPELRAEYANKPERIANRAYANRMGNGPESSGDGWKNRGGGYFQLTGAAIWALYTKYLTKATQGPDLPFTVDHVQNMVRTSERFAVDSSLWYFAIYASLKDEAERDEFRKITIAINGGTNGIEDRAQILTKALLVFS